MMALTLRAGKCGLACALFLAALSVFGVCRRAGSLVAQEGAQEFPKSAPLWATKPDIAAFEKLENDRISAAERAIARITAVKGTRTTENTLAPYDEAIERLNAASYFSSLMEQVHPDAAFRDHASAMTTKVSSASTALSLNREVYNALASLDVSKADAATQHYVERQLLEFRLAGVDKDEATRKRLKDLEDRLTADQSKFERNISDDVRTVEASAAELEGLPEDFLANHKSGADGKIRLTTNYPDLFPALTFAKSEPLRRSLWQAWLGRAYPANREVLLDMLRVRYEIATLLGYSSWADYNAADKMIGNGANIAKFIADLDVATRPLEQREFSILLAEKKKTDPATTQVADYDAKFVTESARRSRYNFDSQSVRPYLPYNEVQKGVLDTAAKLFHVSFQQEVGAPGWAPGVETWDVIEDGKMIGRFYLDMHPRPGKYTHYRSSPVLDGVRGKQMPEGALVCNFPAPTASDPALMEFGDAGTFFHEFGHLMHHILGVQQWAGISGMSMESDFIEAPSQMLEEWMRSPQVVTSFARHYKTGEPMPTELMAQMNRATAFGRANDIAMQNALSAISYDLHKGDSDKIDFDAVTLSDLQRYNLYTVLPTDAHLYAEFDHLSGYSSAYYTYMWDKVIAEDFFRQFDQQNLMAGETPMRYRREVLEPGGSMPASDLVRNFLGRAQNMKALEKWMGEEFKEPRR
jgi:thimet oligopeptidase